MRDGTTAAIDKNWPTMRPTASSSCNRPSTLPEEAIGGGLTGRPGPAPHPVRFCYINQVNGGTQCFALKQAASSHVTVLLLNKMDAVDSRLDSHAQTQ